MRPSKSKRKARIATGMQSTHVAMLGVDVGGTFTDAVLLDGKHLRTAKVPTAEREEESVLSACRAGATHAASGSAYRRVARDRARVPRVRARVDDRCRCVSHTGRLAIPSRARRSCA